MKKVLITMLLTFLVVSCGGDDEDSLSNGGSGSSSSSGIVSSIDKSVGSLAIFSSSSKSGELDFLSAPSACATGDAKTPSAIDYHCSSTGTPLKSVNGDGDYCSYESTDTTYVSEIFYCSVIFNTASPDSLRGALTLANLIECSLANEGYFDFSSGNENSGSVTIDLTTSNTCFSNFTYTDPEPDTGASTDIGAFISGKLTPDMGNSFTVNTTVTNLTSGDWDYDVQFSATVGGESFSMNLKLKDSDDIVAASLKSANEIWSVTVDQGNGVMSFETVDQHNHRRRRTRVAGTFDDQGELDLSQDVSLKAWILEQCINSASTTDDDYCDATEDGETVGWYEFTSIEGTYTASTETSAFTQNQYLNNNGTFSTSVNGVCNTGSASDCTSFSGVTANNSSLDTLSDATDAAFSSMDSNRPVVQYSDVDLGNVPWESL
tara:strand:- start:10210 stop:11511 length:1302 start_codon:yes stop_codon:yes gene_type:complete